ncbi:MAG: energy-coupling factor transporter ATPase [Faecalibacterium sp.]|nr:energy-coupling factor transporter ATPase [Ruminococcus sp.]MCM1392642.1 energy-coupling factor transporter ATPase [Ruminococcus sp.]MCM1486353.1 energy-coupling factor transporter ATPase [Faecalibacterium sp.]
MSVNVLETKDLTYIYSKGTGYEVAAIKDVDISIEKGELVGVIGHTGSGKSTLIQHFNGILKPTSGTVYLDGKDIWEDKSKIRNVRFKVGICFQYPEYQLFEETVYKDISFGPKNMGLTDKEIDAKVRQVINYVGLDESYLEKSPFDLSGGEKRRIAIAGVMAMNPEVLVLDEPCAGLDPNGRNVVLSLIKDYQRLTQSTVIVVSHSMEDISKIASKILVMNDSKLAFYDTVENVFGHADELVSMGLNIPELTKLFIKLKGLGYDVRTNIYNMDDAKNELLKLISGRGENVK